MPNSTAYERIVSALEQHGCRTFERADQVRSQCPGHDSTGLSLIVSRRPDSAGVHCFAGCHTADVLAVLNLTMRDLFDGELPPGYVPPVRREPTPWDVITQGPGIEHVLNRMVREQQLEVAPHLRDDAQAQAEDCHACASAAPTSPATPNVAAMNYMPRDRATEYVTWLKETTE